MELTARLQTTIETFCKGIANYESDEFSGSFENLSNEDLQGILAILLEELDYDGRDLSDFLIFLQSEKESKAQK